MQKSRVVLGYMALALILALLIPLVGCGGGGLAVPCKISSVAGTVQVLRNGSAEPVAATNNMELAVGDTITTGSDGSANLVFFDGSVMEIKTNSQILVNELNTASTGSTAVGLKEFVGSTINRVAKLVDSASKYEVETPAAVTLVRGTIFDLLVLQNGDTTVKSEQGSVSFTASGVTVTVKPGVPVQRFGWRNTFDAISNHHAHSYSNFYSYSHIHQQSNSYFYSYSRIYS